MPAICLFTGFCFIPLCRAQCTNASLGLRSKVKESEKRYLCVWHRAVLLHLSHFLQLSLSQKHETQMALFAGFPKSCNSLSGNYLQWWKGTITQLMKHIFLFLLHHKAAWNLILHPGAQRKCRALAEWAPNQ